MRHVAVRYGAFAVLATLSNLAAQRILLAFAGRQSGEAFVFALLAGTAVGLLVKYVLDKRWIFFDDTRGLAGHGRKFGLYTLTGVVTTLVFWGTETAFWLAWRTGAGRELGAVLGLTIGYLIKYNLDRRFVFASRLAEA